MGAAIYKIMIGLPYLNDLVILITIAGLIGAGITAGLKPGRKLFLRNENYVLTRNSATRDFYFFRVLLSGSKASTPLPSI
jgi:hypothetical protein